jgi:hypothetical protein
LILRVVPQPFVRFSLVVQKPNYPEQPRKRFGPKLLSRLEARLCLRKVLKNKAATTVKATIQNIPTNEKIHTKRIHAGEIHVKYVHTQHIQT